MNNKKPGKWGGNKWNGRGRGGPNRGFGRGGIKGSWRGNYFSKGPYGGQGGNFRGAINRYRDDRNFGYGNWNPNQHWRRPTRDTPSKRLTEDAIGVTKYISDHEGFNGIIKSRYSDFQVSEINEKGEVAKLTNFTPPEPPAVETVDEDEDLLLSKYNLEILPMETWDSMNKLVLAKETTEIVEIDATNMSKEQRTKIHDAVKKAFGNSIVGSTVNTEDKKVLRFDKFRKGVRIDNRVKWIWPGEYVYFIVFKENCDTMDAAARIAERLKLNIKPSMVGYAGNKDRRAVTSQWFSLRKVDPRRVAGFCRGLKDVHIGNFSFSSKNLKLGMLKGNKFRIALRNVTATDDCIDAACRLLQENGFINYYGLQRFGTRIDTPTYEIGLKMLQGNFREAINSILENREGVLQAALQQYHSAGAGAALLQLPRAAAAHVEARLLRALAKAPNDLIGALSKLARNTRLLYLHSYQSLVWNRAVTERITRFGLEPAVGDLVPAAAQPLVTEEMNDGGFEEEEQLNESESELDNTDKPEEKPDDTHTDTTSTKSKKPKEVDEKPKTPVKVLTKEDVESGQYTIFDVILPLPGYHIDYPPNMIDFYEEHMTKDGLKLEMKHKIKSYSMAGAYRHMVVRPFDMQWNCVSYSKPYADLVRSDLDEINGRELTGIEENGKFRALLLTISLPASCYATMALRELLKVDTSCDNQALQNNYHIRKDASKTDDASGGGKPDGGEEIPAGGKDIPDGGKEIPDGGKEIPDGGKEIPDGGKEIPDGEKISDEEPDVGEPKPEVVEEKPSEDQETTSGVKRKSEVDCESGKKLKTEDSE